MSIESELRPGEVVRWQGRPVQGLRFGVLDGLGVLGAIVVSTAFWQWSYEAVRDVRIGMLLLNLGLLTLLYWVFVFRFAGEAVARARRWYAVTDRRVLAVGGGSCVATDWASVTTIEKTRGRRGVGTLRFLEGGRFDRRSGAGDGIRYSLARARMRAPVEFADIPDVDAVHALLDDMRAR